MSIKYFSLVKTEEYDTASCYNNIHYHIMVKKSVTAVCLVGFIFVVQLTTAEVHMVFKPQTPAPRYTK